MASCTAHCLFSLPSSVSAFPSSSFSSRTRRSCAARAVRKAIGSSGVSCEISVIDEGEYAGEAGEALRGERLELAGRIGKDNDSRL